MRLPKSSTYQSAPSGPAAIPAGPRIAVADSPGGRGTLKSVIAPAIVIRPTSPPPYVVNHTAPSGPATIEFGERPSAHSAPSAVGGSEHVGYSVTVALDGGGA